MELTGTVLNVVDFGAFVDIGLHDSGLVHISQLAEQVRPRSARSGRRGRHRQGLGARGRQDAPPRVADDDPARHRADAAQARETQGRSPRTRRPGIAARRGRRPRRRTKWRSNGRHLRSGDNRRSSAASARTPRRTPRTPRPASPRACAQTEASSREPAARRKPTPVVPLTNEMKAGKAPLRTFGDLKQFFEMKSEPEDAPQQDVAQNDGANSGSEGSPGAERSSDAENSPNAET